MSDRKLPMAGKPALKLPNCPMNPQSAPPGDAPPTQAPTGFALFAMGFRPFFLLGALYAALLLPIWLLVLNNRLELDPYFPGASWHAHEMLFGFTMAIVAGFLLTAVRNWTKFTTAIGPRLVGLCALWLAGRIAVVFGSSLPFGIAALVDLAFVPALLLAIGPPLLKKKSRRNYGFFGLLGAAFAANLLFHLDSLGTLSGWSGRAATTTLNLVILIILIISGRIIPLFTRNSTKVDSIHRVPLLNHLALGGMSLFSLLEFLQIGGALSGIVAALTAALVFLRARSWGVQHTLGDPLLWVLHLGHAWIGIGLAFKAALLFGAPLHPACASHALTIGAIGTLIIGMLVRVTLGHTGRPRVAPPVATIAFVLVTLAALLRVLTPLVWIERYMDSLLLSGILWSVAFVLYVVRFTPILLRPRPDGKPG